MKKSFFLFGLVLFLFSACTSQKVFVQSGEGSQAGSKINGQKVLLVISGQVQLTEFKKTFHSMFPREGDYQESLAKDLSEMLKRDFQVDALNISQTNLPKEVDYLPKWIETNKAELKKEGIQSILFIDKLKVGSKTLTSTQFNSAPAGTFGHGTTTTTTSESALVEARMEISLTEAGKNLTEFVVNASDAVVLFSYESALAGAIENLVKHTSGYLLLGKTKF